MSDNITIILSRQQAVTVSAAILSLGSSHHRHPDIEALRSKLREGLNHRSREAAEHDVEASLIAHEYKRRELVH
jgi:hypothetical protein